MDETSLSISVDLEPHAADKRPTPEALRQTVERLLELLALEGVAATWVTTEPQTSELIARVLEADGHHEAALLVPSAWMHSDNGRSRFAAEFVLQMKEAKASGISLSTLAIENDLPSEHLELLVRRGITAIRTDRPAPLRLVRRDGSSGAGAAPIRYGLWQIPCEMRYCGGGWLAQRIAAQRIRRDIERLIAASAAGHLVIEAPALALRADAKMTGLKAILQHIRRDRPWDLRVGTICETVARLAAPRASRAAQSILRAA
jgi:hypothetical protein